MCSIKYLKFPDLTTKTWFFNWPRRRNSCEWQLDILVLTHIPNNTRVIQITFSYKGHLSYLSSYVCCGKNLVFFDIRWVMEKAMVTLKIKRKFSRTKLFFILPLFDCYNCWVLGKNRFALAGLAIVSIQLPSLTYEAYIEALNI